MLAMYEMDPSFAIISRMRELKREITICSWQIEFRLRIIEFVYVVIID